MTETINQMRRRHAREIDKLQKECPHPRISKWLEYWWAPGHSAGQVRVCKVCGKILKRRGGFGSLPEPDPHDFENIEIKDGKCYIVKHDGSREEIEIADALNK